jgi:peptide/nickel transport system ATP-binding protein
MSALPAFGDEEVVLDVHDLSVRVGETNLVSDVTFAIGRGERVGLIGESGSGKSLTGLSLMGLLPEDLVASGSVRLPGPDLDVVGADDDAMSRIRGRDVAMVFQEPMTALNPTMRVGDQVAEALLIHRTKTDRNAARRRAMELLGQVRLPEPADTARAYPHQLSGGQRQRTGVARALANDPPILLFDEPFGALDPVTRNELQKQFIGLRDTLHKTALFVTHDTREALLVGTRIALLSGGQLNFLGSNHDFTQSTDAEAKAFLETISLAAQP